VLLRFVQGLGASDSVTIEIDLAQSVEGRGGGQTGVALGVLHRSRLTFQIDMFQAEGRLPTNLNEVAEREKDIRYSSRTQICSNAFRDRHEVRHAINELHKLLPPDPREYRISQAPLRARLRHRNGCSAACLPPS
jgi:hypothetical protein